MAYDAKLAARIERIAKGWPDCAPKKMFGGVGWLLNGNMCVGIWKDSLILRCDPIDAAGLLRKKHARAFDVTGRPMKGWLLIEPKDLATPTALTGWLALARDYVRTLPKK